MNGRLLLNVRIVVPTLLGRRLNSTLPQFSTINVTEARKHVYQVELNRPKTRNSLNFEVWKELKVAFDHLDKFAPCRTIILSGKGPSFCAGIDLKEGIASLLNITGNSDTDVSRKAYYLNQRILEAQEGFNAIEKNKKPVIAVIQGHCYGAATSMISCADIRYAVSDAQFSIKEPDVGLTADVGILQRLQKITGNESWAREIAFTARSFSGSEALNFGLVSRIFDNNGLCLSSALDLAEEIASKSPVVTYGTKLAMNYSRDHTIQDSLEWIKNWNSAHLQTQDMHKIAEAMMSKKKPVFEDVLVGMLNTGKFAGKTLVISGASRGIGRSIALKLAKDGANVAILAKTAEAHAKLPGTIYSVAEEIEKAGGKALPCAVDIRDEKSCERAIEETVKKFGGIDICCNNASAISLTGTTETPMKKYDLMNSVNTRGTFLLSKLCIPYLKQSKNAHILTLSPPLLMDKIWFSNHVAYTIAKYGMSMCTLGMAEELKPDKIAVNSLWPQTQVWTAAMKMLSGGDDSAGSRIPEIVADAAYAILSRRSTEYTGNFAIDEEVLREEGVTDFEQYACVKGAPLNLDFFIPGASAELPIGGKHAESRKDIKTKSLEESINSLKGLLHDEEVKKLRSVFEFKIQDGDNLRTIHMDLANAKLNEGSAEKANVIFTTDSNCFVDMLDGHLKPSNAFMSQKLKIKGDITAALKLEKLLGKLHKKK